MEKEKSKKYPVMKIAIFVFIVVLLETIGNAVQPLVLADVSIKGQLADSDASYAGYQIYKKLTAYAPLAYIAVGLLIFRKELKTLIKGIN